MFFLSIPAKKSPAYKEVYDKMRKGLIKLCLFIWPNN